MNEVLFGVMLGLALAGCVQLARACVKFARARRYDWYEMVAPASHVRPVARTAPYDWSQH